MIEDWKVGVEVGSDGQIVLNSNIVITIFLVIFVFFVILKAAVEYFEVKRRKNVKFVFDVLFELHLKYKFAAQSKDTLVCLKNGVRAMLGPHVRRPAVILLLAADDSKSTAMELATRLLQITLAAMDNHKTERFIRDHLYVDGNCFSGLTDFWEFYNTIRNKIRSNKVVLVTDFQSVHPHAVTVLPSLTHEVFCPQSQALIVLLMSLNYYHNPCNYSVTTLATEAVEQTFGTSLDSGQLDDLQRTVTARASLILPEPQSTLMQNKSF